MPSAATRRGDAGPGGRVTVPRDEEASVDERPPGNGPRIEGFDPDEFGGVDAPWSDTVGIEWDLLSPDRVEAHVDVGRVHQQPFGIVHGGVYCSIVETLASIGATINAVRDGKVVVGVSNTTDFVTAHREGRLDAVATPVQRGRHQHLWDVELRREDGRLVARGTVRLQVLDPEVVGTRPPRTS